TTNAAGLPIVDREKTAPFLIRVFLKVGSFHHISLFQDGPLPTADEQQIFTWKDATLHEVLTTLRAVGPNTPEYRHPLARYAFRTVFPDARARGQFATKDLGLVYSRDILGEPGTAEKTAPRLLQDEEPTGGDGPEGARTLEELRFVPGDYLCVSVTLPKNAAPPPELNIKGSAGGANGWKASGPLGPPRGPGFGGGPPSGRGAGGHWRGGSDAPPATAGRGRGRGDFVGRERDRDERDRDFRGDRDRRPPPPPPSRRDSPPHRAGWGRRERSYSPGRSRSPPRRR
ncbi:Sin3 associated polypeptide p18-domain-containing protein, partial [Vararia minispora EC-137]